jgi:hypothetical protein
MSLSNKFIGIKDLLDEQRYRVQHLQDELIKQDVPGSNWHSYMNVYNLVRGAYPNDAYVFVFLAEFLNLDINIIISRYSERNSSAIGASRRESKKKEVETEDLF